MRVTGWLLDIYTLENINGVVLWLIGGDGKRYRFEHAFPVTFYAAGPAQDLRALWRYLQSQPEQLSLRATMNAATSLPE